MAGEHHLGSVVIKVPLLDEADMHARGACLPNALREPRRAGYRVKGRDMDPWMPAIGSG